MNGREKSPMPKPKQEQGMTAEELKESLKNLVDQYNLKRSSVTETELEGMKKEMGRVVSELSDLINNDTIVIYKEELEVLKNQNKIDEISKIISNLADLKKKTIEKISLDLTQNGYNTPLGLANFE